MTTPQHRVAGKSFYIRVEEKRRGPRRRPLLSITTG
jgi:hypothetical protein